MMAAGSLSRPAVLEILQELIRTPSVNPGLSPGEAHGEEAIAKVAQNWLTANARATYTMASTTANSSVVSSTFKVRRSGNAMFIIPGDSRYWP